MAKCSKCRQNAVYKSFCKDHFTSWFEDRFFGTINKFKLIRKDERICVAASGGKDSTTLLYLLSKRYKVEALAIDEGIKGYRDKSLVFLKNFCKANKIPLKIISYKSEFNITMDSLRPKGTHCSVCGPLRRKLLNKYSKNFDIVATGHNMDDELQAYFMNLFKNTMKLAARQGPRTINEDGLFTTKIKPLYFFSEKEVKIYSILKGFDTEFSECPYSSDAFRNEIRQFINQMESINPGFKEKSINEFVDMLPKLRKYYKTENKAGRCSICKDICSGEICQACMMTR